MLTKRVFQQYRGQLTLSQRYFSSSSTSEQDAIFERKFLDHRTVEWPEVNPIDLHFTDYSGKGTVKLHNYRYPADQNVARKGIVTFTHGHGDYMGRYAWMAQKIAAEGYDVVGMDARGHGLSEGRRGIIEGRDIIRDDTLFYA